MNNDLISRSALLEALENEKIRIAVDKGKMFRLIEAAPAVDAVEVVRCKDRKKRDTVNCPMEERYVEYPQQSTKHDDFCSHGERRSE